MHILPPMVQCITHDACEGTSCVLESGRNHFSRSHHFHGRRNAATLSESPLLGIWYCYVIYC